jgi:hypothetical protein
MCDIDMGEECVSEIVDFNGKGTGPVVSVLWLNCIHVG